MITSMIEDVTKAAKTFGSLVRDLGPINVAFFVLLGFGLIMQARFVVKAAEVHTEIVNELMDVRETQDQKNISDASANAILLYYQRKICENTARTELAKLGCNPRPSMEASQL